MFFEILSFRGIGNTTFNVSVLKRIIGWLEITTEIHANCGTDCFGAYGKK